MTLHELLANLESSQLIRRSDDPDPSERSGQGLAYFFKHSLTQETTYESLLLKRRREIHRRVAECMEQLYADRLDESAAVLAQHYCEAGDDAKTLEFAIRAGDAAMRIYANTEAIAEYSLALEAASRGAVETGVNGHSTMQELYLKRGRALELLSRFDDAVHNYEQMETAAVASGDRAFQLSALMARATVHAIPGSARDPERAQMLSDQALRLAHELSDRKAEAKILWNLLLLSIYTGGDAQRAIEYGERSLAIAREFNLREQAAYTLHDLFVAYAYVGNLDKARELRQEASKIWRELDNLPMLAESLSGLALLHFLIGEFDEAISLGQEASQIGRSIGNLGSVGFSGYTLGLVYLECGEIDQAVKAIEDAIPITQVGGLEGNGISPNALLGLIHTYMGDVGGARELIETTFARASTKVPIQRIWLYALLTRVELMAGDLEAARSAFREGPVEPSMENFRRMFPAGAPQLYFSATEFAIAEKDYGRANEAIDSLLTHLRQVNIRAFLPEALHLKAEVLLAQGETGQALETWRAAHAEATAIGSRRILWLILRAQSRVAAASGDQAEADGLLAEAREVVKFIADHAPHGLKESFMGIPDVRLVVGS